VSNNQVHEQLGKFVSAIELLGEIDPEERNKYPPSNKLELLFRGCIDHWADPNTDLSKLYGYIKAFGSDFLQAWRDNRNPIINHCHGVSGMFYESLVEHFSNYGIGMHVTVGNVSFDGAMQYDNVTQSSIKALIERGVVVKDEEPVNAHVWITLENMTVLDLSIMHTLHHRGLISDDELNHQPVLIWHPDQESRLAYKPILVDNQFHRRVDDFSTKGR